MNRNQKNNKCFYGGIYNQQQSPIMGYDEIIKIIYNIFTVNFLEKTHGEAILIDYEQIGKWFNYFNKFSGYDIPHTKENNNNISQIDINFRGNINHIINELLLLGEGKISLCGGSLSSIIFEKCNFSDWDIFFHCDSEEEANIILLKCLNYLEEKESCWHTVTQRVHTVSVGEWGMKIQFIKRLYKSKDQVLLGFDLAGSRIGYNPVDGLYATICGGLSIAMKCFPVDTTQRSLSFGRRLEKYSNKGFTLLYPGISHTDKKHISNDDVAIRYMKRNNEYDTRYNFSEHESDYENEVTHFNWIYIIRKQFDSLAFKGSLDEIFNFSDKMVTNSIQAHGIFMTEESPPIIYTKTHKLFLGDRYKEYVMEIVINEDMKAGRRIWEERCDWYVKQVKKNVNFNIFYWKTENPGSQSFGKFNPILEDPRKWYGNDYKPVEAGIKTSCLKAFIECTKNISYMNVPNDVFRLLCDYWLKAEVDLAREYLFSLH